MGADDRRHIVAAQQAGAAFFRCGRGAAGRVPWRHHSEASTARKIVTPDLIGDCPARIRNLVIASPSTALQALRINCAKQSRAVYAYPGLLRFARNDGVSGLHGCPRDNGRSEEHTSELQSLMRISYAVFCLKK